MMTITHPMKHSVYIFLITLSLSACKSSNPDFYSKGTVSAELQTFFDAAGESTDSFNIMEIRNLPISFEVKTKEEMGNRIDFEIKEEGKFDWLPDLEVRKDYELVDLTIQSKSVDEFYERYNELSGKAQKMVLTRTKKVKIANAKNSLPNFLANEIERVGISTDYNTNKYIKINTLIHFEVEGWLDSVEYYFLQQNDSKNGRFYFIEQLFSKGFEEKALNQFEIYINESFLNQKTTSERVNLYSEYEYSFFLFSKNQIRQRFINFSLSAFQHEFFDLRHNIPWMSLLFHSPYLNSNQKNEIVDILCGSQDDELLKVARLYYAHLKGIETLKNPTKFDSLFNSEITYMDLKAIASANLNEADRNYLGRHIQRNREKLKANNRYAVAYLNVTNVKKLNLDSLCNDFKRLGFPHEIYLDSLIKKYHTHNQENIMFQKPFNNQFLFEELLMQGTDHANLGPEYPFGSTIFDPIKRIMKDKFDLILTIQIVPNEKLINGHKYKYAEFYMFSDKGNEVYFFEFSGAGALELDLTVMIANEILKSQGFSQRFYLREGEPSILHLMEPGAYKFLKEHYEVYLLNPEYHPGHVFSW